MKIPKTATPVSILPPDDGRNTQYGTLYDFKIVMDNGDEGQYSSQNDQQNKFVVGQETEYEFDTSYPQFPKIRPINNFNPQNKGNTSGSYQKSVKSSNSDQSVQIARSVAIKSAVELNKSNGVSMSDCIDDAKLAEQYILKG